jgi:hypothetical protein
MTTQAKSSQNHQQSSEHNHKEVMLALSQEINQAGFRSGFNRGNRSCIAEYHVLKIHHTVPAKAAKYFPMQL